MLRLLLGLSMIRQSPTRRVASLKWLPRSREGFLSLIAVTGLVGFRRARCIQPELAQHVL